MNHKALLQVGPRLLAALLVCACAAHAVHAEQQVVYTDMIEAYAAGDVERARQLARGHLERHLALLAAARQPTQTQAVVHRLLGIERALVEAENQLPPAERFGNRSPFFGLFARALAETRAARHGLTLEAKVEEFFNRELATLARGWLVAQSGIVSAGELEASFREYQGELARLGITRLDEIRESPPSPPPPPPEALRPKRVDSGEAAAITAVVRAYFEGLIAGDTARLARATGREPAACRALLDALEADLRQEGIRSVDAVTVPDLTAEELQLRVSPSQEETWGMAVDGIRLELTLEDGSAVTRTIRKRLRIRQDANKSGGWTLVIPDQE